MTDDWFDALVCLLDANARFLTVGAHAMAVHGIPRATQDLDVWIEPNRANALRVWDALARFGAPLDTLDVQLDDLIRTDTVVQIGLPPNRIDILTSISGVSDFTAAWDSRVIAAVRGRDIPFLDRASLLANKRAAGRPKDLADLEALGGRRQGG
jgi:hypothetical protein